MLIIVSRHRSLRLSPITKLPMRLGVFFLCLASLVLAGAALAGGGTTIASAPTVDFGVQYFGNTAAGKDIDYRFHEFWKVSLIAGDSLTIKFENASGSWAPGVGVLLLYASGTDDFNYSDADYWNADTSDNGHGQLVQTAPTTGVYPLDFVSAGAEDADAGVYDFTAYVKHAVRLRANASTLRYRGTWTVGVLHADGSPISDSSLSLKLFLKKGCCWKAVGKGTVSGGKAAVKYALPKSTRKHVVKLKLIASGSAYKSTAVTRSVHIRK